MPWGCSLRELLQSKYLIGIILWIGDPLPAEFQVLSSSAGTGIASARGEGKESLKNFLEKSKKQTKKHPWEWIICPLQPKTFGAEVVREEFGVASLGWARLFILQDSKINTVVEAENWWMEGRKNAGGDWKIYPNSKMDLKNLNCLAKDGNGRRFLAGERTRTRLSAAFRSLIPFFGGQSHPKRDLAKETEGNRHFCHQKQLFVPQKMRPCSTQGQQEAWQTNQTQN